MSMAFFCAVEPAPSSWPLPQDALDALEAPEDDEADVAVVLLSEPHAASVSELTAARAPMARALVRPFRWSFTRCPFLGAPGLTWGFAEAWAALRPPAQATLKA